MRRTSAFRALAVETLEDRLVLSHVSAPASSSALHQRSHTPATPQEQLTVKVRAAYGAFEQNFTNMVNTDLYLPGITGSLGSNLPLFSDQLGKDLTTLDEGVLRTMGHGSASTPTGKKVRELIIGSSSNSLKNRLSRLTISSMGLGSAFTSYEATALQEIRQNFLRVKQVVVGSLASGTAPAPAGS
jgi:hypothetical protein